MIRLLSDFSLALSLDKNFRLHSQCLQSILIVVSEPAIELAENINIDDQWHIYIDEGLELKNYPNII